MNRTTPSTHPSSDKGHSVVAAPVTAHPLAELIAHEIRERGGWMGFERFMELALYAPGLGYYSGGRRVLGQRPQDGSDFVTAPELTPLFGEVLARQVLQALDATGTDEVWEFGAGTGALAEQLLGELGDRIQRYVIVDLSGSLRDRQHQRLLKAHPSLVHKVIWADSLPEAMSGVIVGNEVLDAMPVHLLSWDGARWQERGVALAPQGDTPHPTFAWADRPAPEGVRPPTEHPDSAYPPGTVTETHGQAEAFVATLAQRMVRGAAFFLDYGFPEAEYHLPQRHGGTLMCHHAHTADADPLAMVGDKDITAHVNFTGIALAGQEAGWEVLGYCSQGRFLTNCGLGEALARTGQASNAADIQSRVALQMLVAEHEMGELFKVIGFVKGPWFEAIGFAHGDRTHTL
ncbi:SAM-dependent MidA family methyltransferase [Aquabacterium commune]|uniref:SAM-dependent MidA family methyltransferase n=1 Tax=Aquabacterium commune TaxID=70586 RepID=A0A4R6R4M6_9BURK|nr:SAM-dependent MidA family methyltransferase [Aquabacterium commune]